jgi:DSF synthase
MFMSSALLKELRRAAGFGAGLPSAPFRFRVLASALPGTFSLGGDLEFFARAIEVGDRHSLKQYANAAVDAIFENLSASGYDDLTTVSLVEGEAQGGGFEAALSSHILIAEKGCHFGFPEGLFGLFPGMGGGALLAARCGDSQAGRILGSTRRWRAEELYDCGVIDVLADAGHGRRVLSALMSDPCTTVKKAYRTRFLGITKKSMIEDVDDWVERAMELSTRHVRAMRFIVKAQHAARVRRMPSTA